MFAFEENHEQIVRNAAAWGIDLKSAEENGLLKILCEYPERRGMEDYLIHMQRAITDFEPERIAIDIFPRSSGLRHVGHSENVC